MAKNNPFYVQVKLQHIETGIFMTCWLENDPKIKVGRKLTIKDCEFAPKNEWWEVINKFNVLSKDQLHTDWNNNI